MNRIVILILLLSSLTVTARATSTLEICSVALANLDHEQIDLNSSTESDSTSPISKIVSEIAQSALLASEELLASLNLKVQEDTVNASVDGALEYNRSSLLNAFSPKRRVFDFNLRLSFKTKNGVNIVAGYDPQGWFTPHPNQEHYFQEVVPVQITVSVQGGECWVTYREPFSLRVHVDDTIKPVLLRGTFSPSRSL